MVRQWCGADVRGVEFAEAGLVECWDCKAKITAAEMTRLLSTYAWVRCGPYEFQVEIERSPTERYADNWERTFGKRSGIPVRSGLHEGQRVRR